MYTQREQIEHAHTSSRRLRARLRALAGLVTSHAPGGRAERVAQEAITALDVLSCVFQRFDGRALTQTVATWARDELGTATAERLTARFSGDVISAKRAVAVNGFEDSHQLTAAGKAAPLYCYLGVPLYDLVGEISGVASVIGGPTRAFTEEDDWWLKAASQAVADELAYEVLENRFRELQRAAAGAGPGAAVPAAVAEAARMSILVVDDDRAVNDLVCEFLTLEGYRVEAAFNGLEAVRLFRPADHDVVMTDVAMPLMNGWELIAALRVRVPDLPVVLITGYGSGNWNESYLLKQGVCATLSKPLDLTKLDEILKTIAARRKQAVLS